MANTYYWFTSWTSTEGSDMSPGDVHWWWAICLLTATRLL